MTGNTIDTLWQILAIFLVLLMQAGFLMLEGGRVRSKNSINVAQKNVADLIIVWACYMGIGYFVMYGVPAPGLTNGPENITDPSPLDFVFQFGFACTTATILSGAISERLSFRAYLVIVAVMTIIFYPLAGRLVWGDSFNPDVTAYLKDWGFIDFAGSTVVHGVGAWFGLVTLLLLGPRIGRFNQAGEPQMMPAHNAVVAFFGVLLLMLGWLGFNGGAVSVTDPLLQDILFNTLNGAVFGALLGMAIGVYLDKGVFNPSRVTSGLLGGLVACTAGVHFMQTTEAMLVGALGGVVATYGAHVLLHKYKLDDPLDVVATHGLAGVAGTLAVAFVAPVEALLGGSRLLQFGVQFAGVAIVFVLSCVGCWATIVILRRFMDFRVSAEAEQIGLNYTEHGESIGLSRLQKALEETSEKAGNFADGLLVDADDEHSELAATLNKVINKYEDAQDEVIAANERFRQFAETASDWLWESDKGLVVTFIHTNSEAEDADLMTTLRDRCLLDLLDMDASVRDQVHACLHDLRDTPVFEATFPVSVPQELRRTLEVRGVPKVDVNGDVMGYRGTITDISVRKAAESRALFLSVHDELTGLPNRRALTRDLEHRMAAAQKADRALVVAGVDLDGFKAVNDAYGHLVGDALLKQVADRLERFLRPIDTAYRTGGDEFVVTLCDLDPKRAIPIAKAIMQRLIEVIAEVYYVRTMNINVGVSVGVASCPEHACEGDDILRMADLAMYEAKARGKGCVVDFSPEMDVDARLQLKIENDLHKAVEQEEFYLVYQPQFDTTMDGLIGFEALIRWAHPERGEIQPADFISVAEKMNLMDKIGSFVLDSACQFASGWDTPVNGNELKVAVNVSPQQFRNPGFLQTVSETLSRYNLPPERLELEITEEVLVHDFTEVASVLEQLRDLGVRVAVDDFGSGQSSLRYLNQFPISTIKIDRSFIKHLTNDNKAAEITRTIVALGHRLGVNVLAEGVEESDQLNLLQQWNCDHVQGFLSGKPMSVPDVESLVYAASQAGPVKKRA